MTNTLFHETSKSLVKKYLSTDVYQALRQKSTDSGCTLDQAIRSGIKNSDSSIGIYAGDAQSYTTFSRVFEPIILHYHGMAREDKHIPNIRTVDLADPDPENRFILSTRVRVARNITGFCFTSHIDMKDRKILERKIIDALLQLQGNLKGSYCSMEHPDKKPRKYWQDRKMRFEKGDRFQDAAGINSGFPRYRGIFSSCDKRLRVWVNEEDHMRIISQETSSDLSSVFNHLCKALLTLEEFLDFVKDDTYGYLTSCPTNLGTAMRAGVHIRLEKLNKKRSILQSLIDTHDLQIRGTSGEKTSIENGIFDISNRRRLGISETDIITNLHNGLLAIIDAEKKLGNEA